jgi:hypothetical protein
MKRGMEGREHFPSLKIASKLVKVIRRYTLQIHNFAQIRTSAIIVLFYQIFIA